MADFGSHVAQRELPHPVLENIWMWSVFSQEKQFYFNGFALKTEEGLVIIDPPRGDEAVFEALRPLERPTLVILTNRDHERASDAFRRHYHIPVACHELDAPLLEVQPEQTFKNAFVFPGGLHVIHLPFQKSPGESAVYWPAHRTLLLGDAIIGNPAGHLSMLAPDKYADLSRAREGLNMLGEMGLKIDALLLGDGEPVFKNGTLMLSQFLDGK